MSSKRRVSLNLTNSTHKALRLDSVNKILKIDRNKRHRKEVINKQASRIALADLIKNTPSAPSYNESLDFKTFISHQENISVFREFLQAQYCQENLDFYLACEKYRHLDPEKVGQEMVKFMVNQIYNDYLREDARQPVNVNRACVEEIGRNLRSPHPNLLSEAQAEIYELMRTDCYPRFWKTWEMDKSLAEKILSKQLVITRAGSSQSANSSSCLNSFICSDRSATHLDRTSSSTLPSPVQSTSSRSTRSSKLSTSAFSGCPPECPYFSVGRLPCQRHGRMPAPVEARGQKRRHDHDTNPLNYVDLRTIHEVPNVCPEDNGLPSTLLASPPPPPLPPKPDKVDLCFSGNKKFRPYVGKVFEV